MDQWTSLPHSLISNLSFKLWIKWCHLTLLSFTNILWWMRTLDIKCPKGQRCKMHWLFFRASFMHSSLVYCFNPFFKLLSYAHLMKTTIKNITKSDNFPTWWQKIHRSLAHCCKLLNLEFALKPRPKIKKSPNVFGL